MFKKILTLLGLAKDQTMQEHAPLVPCNHTPRADRIIATFVPEGYSCGDVVPVGPPADIDVTMIVLALCLYDIQGLKDSTVAADALVDPSAFGHCGPYTVQIEQGLRDFFGLQPRNFVGEPITDELTFDLLLQARELAGVPHESDIPDAARGVAMEVSYRLYMSRQWEARSKRCGQTGGLTSGAVSQ